MIEAATVYDRGCNRTRSRLQPNVIEAAPLTLTLTLTLTLALALTLTLTLGLPEELVGAELEAFEGQSPHEGRCHSCVQTQHALLA